MNSLKVLLIFAALASSTLQSPLKSDESVTERRSRAEEKNWKVNTNFYDGKALDDKLLDEPSTYRLPNDTRPIRYDIHLKTDVDKADFNFNGRVKIHIRAVEVTSVVTLQYRDITIAKVSLIGISDDQIITDGLSFELISQFEFLKISLPNPLQVNDEIRLEIHYNGTLNPSNTGAGFYRASYEENGSTIYYGVTQFESTDARHAFPCYDEPAIRAPIALEIQHDKTYNSYSNMPLQSVTPVEGTDYVISKFEDTPPVQTYLIAFIVSPFHSLSNNDPIIPQEILAKPSSIADGSADFAVSISDPIMKKLVNLFNVNYTLPKLDHAAIAQFSAGAMENWGLVTYRERYLLFTPTNNPTQDESRKRDIIAVMAHEDAHQFFGNLVAPHWWSDLWLNEGFATLYEYYIPHLLYPDDGWMEEFRVNEINYSFRYDVLSGNRVPMHHYVESPIDIDRRFDSISYTKSGVVLHMFQHTLSEPTFTKGLTKYLNKMALKVATPDDLFSSIQESYDEDYPGNNVDISKAMGSWVYQAGYPIVEVSRNDDGFISFKQRRYPDSNGELYIIPVSYTTDIQTNLMDTRARIWLNQTETLIHHDLLGMSSDGWIVLNIQQTGYYRVGYSSNLWRSTAKALKTDHNQFHLTNRRVLQDELNLGYSTLKNIRASDVLEVLSYLVDETEYTVWSDAGTVLRTLNTTLFGTAAYPHFLEFIRTISAKQLESIGMGAIEGESVEQRNLRNQVKNYNCYAFDEKCLNHELEKLKLFQENEFLNPIPDFCSAFRNLPPQEYLDYLFQIITNTDLIYRTRIVSSIGCSLNKDLLSTLTQFIDIQMSVVTSTERITIINNMMVSSTVGFEVAFEYLENNLEMISSFITNLRERINTMEYYERLSKMLDEAITENFITEANANDIKNRIRANLEWQENYLDNVLKWFNGEDEETTTQRQDTTTTNINPTSTNGETTRAEETMTSTETTTPSTGTTTDLVITTTDSANGVFLSAVAFITWIFIQIWNNI